MLAAGGDPGRLRATLDSVRDQPSPQLEILVVSRPHDAEAARALAGDDTRVRFLTADAVHQARVLGVRRARGMFVLVATPGDVYPPGVLAEISQALNPDGAAFLHESFFPRAPTSLAALPALATDPRLGRLLAPRPWLLEALGGPPDEDPDGMVTALWLLRRQVRAAGYPTYRSTRNEPAGPFVRRTDPFPSLAGHVAHDLATLEVLADLPEARKARAAGAMLSLRGFLEVADSASEDDWAVLAAHAAEMRDAAVGALATISVRARLLALLAADGLREDVLRLAEEVGEDYPTTVHGDRVVADLDVPAGVLPDGALTVEPAESYLEAQARRLVVDGTTLRLELSVGVRHVDRTPDDVVTVTLVDGDVEVPMRVTAGSDPAPGVFCAEIDAKDLPERVHLILVTWARGALERATLLSSVALNGSAAREPVALGPQRSVELHVRHGRVGLVVTRRKDLPPAPVRRVEVTDESLRLTVDGTIDRVWLEGPDGVVEGVPGATGFWSVPLHADRWGLGTTPLPTGFYRLVLARAGTRVPGVMDQALLDRVEFTVRTAHHRVVVERRAGDQVGVRLGPLLTDDELGPAAQARLQREFSVAAPPLDPRLVYFQSFTGQWAGDNPFAIQRELFARRQDLDLRWVVADSSATVPEGCTPLLFRSREWYDVMTRASYLVTNIELEKWYARRPGQQVLQTFHGYPSKAMGLGLWRPRGMTPRQIENQLDHTSRVWNTLVTPSPEMDQYYRRDYAYDGTILPVGYPRNDVLVTEAAEQLRAETRERLGIRPDQHAILYAPTWRDDRATNFRAAEAVDHLDVEQAAAALGEGYVLLLRGHRFHAPTGGGGRVIDVTSYPDINHLIAASDAAVLDYSSLRFDFALTGRPMVFLVPDLDAYDGRVRGFLWDYRETAPGPLVSTTAEVLLMLRDLDSLARQYVPDLAAFNARYNALHDGHASERVVSAFFADLLG